MGINHHCARGIIEAGGIKLLEPVDLDDGTVVEVTITVSPESKQARERQRNLLREGIHLGGPPYARREELYER